MATPDPRLELFATELNQWRKAREWSYAHVASVLAQDEAITVTGSAVGEWCRGESEPSRDKVFALERIFDLFPGHFTRLLGYEPPTEVTGKASVKGGGKAGGRGVRISASGVDLDELRRLDPEAYQAIIRQAEIALDRARDRRKG